MGFRVGAALIVAASAVTVSAGQDTLSSRLDSSQQRALVLKVAGLIREEYIFPDVADRTAAELTHRAETDAYSTARTTADFAAVLTRELGELTHDKHVRVRYAPAATGTRMPQEIDPAIDNFGVHRVEWLPNRVGYLKIDRFYQAEESRPAFDAALALLAAATAIVIDLRENGGGSDANNLLASYLFAERTLFNELRWRKEDPDVLFTDPSVRPQLASTPLFVLTSGRTFSAAEAFAYSLQQRKRAVVVGERTGGGANPNRYFPLAPGLAVSIAIGTTVNPVSRSNWEGTGVVPDVEVSAASALDTVLQRLERKP
jgi:retinol-binding protein 3